MPLPRLHLFEFNDADAVPDVIREAIVDTLSQTLQYGGILRGLCAPFQDFLTLADCNEVLDLCSGSAGPARILLTELQRQGASLPQVVLTDLYPRVSAWEQARAAFPGQIQFHEDPLDATRIPDALSRGRARTIINAFHHFPPSLAQAILDDAIRCEAPILIAEGFGRNPLGFARFAPVGIPMLFANPLYARRQRLARAALTWAVPIIPAAAIFDGIVSSFRMYLESDFRRMVAHAGDGWIWRWGTYDVPFGGKGTFFYGIPPVRTGA